jgi:methanogenic corrinoid protein MtbC1
MNKDETLYSIRDALVNLNFEGSKEYTKIALENGVDPKEIILKCRGGHEDCWEKV